MNMKININKIEISIKKDKKDTTHKNLLATASITLKDEAEDSLTISGITIWKSKINNDINIEPPKNRFFKYCYGGLWKKIKKEIIKEYDYENIPVVEDSIL